MRSAIGAALMRADSAAPEKLSLYLDTRYGGNSHLFYKGREALAAAFIRSGLPEGSAVCITGYTCYAVYQAVISAHLVPVFTDIAEGDVNFTAASLDMLCRRRPDIRAVVLQNTYGFPQDIAGIEKAAKKFGLIVIEDLAHAVGTTYKDGRQAGTVGDYTALSFSQDKMLDAVSGGALIIRRGGNGKVGFPGRGTISRKQILKDRFYPLITSAIRTTYPVPGKLIHETARRMGVLSQPMGDTAHLSLHDLPSFHATLAMQAFTYHREDASHRQNIANIYASVIKPAYTLPALTPLLNRAVPVRFPIIVRDRQTLISDAKRAGLHISDIWYDAPVAPKKLFLRTTYAGECPNGEVLSETVINLPTHRNVSPADAREICSFINKWHIQR
jgi:perosamine synthetase